MTRRLSRGEFYVERLGGLVAEVRERGVAGSVKVFVGPDAYARAVEDAARRSGGASPGAGPS